MYVSNIWYWSIVEIRILSSTISLVATTIMGGTLGLATLRTSRIGPMKLGVNNGIAITILKDVLEWLTVSWIASASTCSWILN